MFKEILQLALQAGLAYLTPNKVDDLAVATQAINLARLAIVNHKDKAQTNGTKAMNTIFSLHSVMDKAQVEIDKANAALLDLEAKHPSNILPSATEVKALPNESTKQ